MSLKRPELAPIRFGTDGWRALIAQDYTFENVERVAQAYADYLLQLHPNRSETDAFEKPSNPRVIVGYDRRFLSEHFARRAAEVLAGNAFEVSLCSAASRRSR
ncbi:MAG: hypothetical protein LC754_06235 [Acidobacteria bacterium]|nr:hypothetical protein [Acidobacteriota bacterium]